MAVAAEPELVEPVAAELEVVEPVAAAPAPAPAAVEEQQEQQPRQQRYQRNGPGGGRGGRRPPIARGPERTLKLSEVEVGKTYTGVVVGTIEFGAFVNIGAQVG